MTTIQLTLQYNSGMSLTCMCTVIVLASRITNTGTSAARNPGSEKRLCSEFTPEGLKRLLLELAGNNYCRRAC